MLMGVGKGGEEEMHPDLYLGAWIAGVPLPERSNMASRRCSGTRGEKREFSVL